MSFDALSFKVTYHLVQSLFALHYLLWTLTNSKMTYHPVQSVFASHSLVWMLTNSKVTYHPMPLVSASRNWRIVRCIKPLHYTHYSASLPTLRWRVIRWSQSLHHALCSGWLQTLRWRQSAFPCDTLVWLITNSKVTYYPVGSVLHHTLYYGWMLLKKESKHFFSSHLFAGGRIKTMLIWKITKHHKRMKSSRDYNSVQLSSVQDGIYALRKTHMRSTPYLRRVPKIAFETFPLESVSKVVSMQT